MSVACRHHEPPRPVVSAEFGVFFGGQVQERQQIPLIVDHTHQLLGFRLRFPAPLSRPMALSWEVDRPAPKAARNAAQRAVQLFEGTVPVGSTQFDQRLDFAPGDPLGTWNIRVRVDGEIVIDRPFLVTPP